MANQQGQMHQNMQTGNIPQQLNHGGHEVFDVHEVLSGSIGALNTYTLLRQFVKDPELADIMDRQYRFLQDEYNITLECFKTGTDPSKPTQSYKMKQGNDFVYGIKPSQPKKPIQSASEINEEIVSGFLLGALKSMASMKTMAALETTNPVVRRVLADSVPNCIEMAYEINIYQNKHHYYQIPQLAQQDMQQFLNSFAPAQGQPPMQNNQMTH
ncbi:spore coat protein [Bacillus methanolicus]|uniref:Spore coat protein F-like protein YhcQ n=1 Tax=Bacillus methanolicus (strain MGA3 / ATCC 53907) TaxID=796606 RepID=I3E8D7_BACMM|nr:spore coat protein [Bacillus methanolicus]AIE60030.1 Spore coat protein F-like protein YhcQ [Bacillus methanolicus MGA3]EIJ82758.1 Coat F domain protein [Bacillus methanolicus MGA3]